MGLERLETRCLLAVLTVGGGSRWNTIQSAVDEARAGDTIFIRDGEYRESVDLSRMGSQAGLGPGDLVIRGESAAGTVVASPSGSVFFNSLPFPGDLAFERLTLTAAPGAGSVPGIRLQEVTGAVGVVDAVFAELSGTGFELLNATGDLTIADSEFRNVGRDGSGHAIRIAEFNGRGAVTRNGVLDAADTGIVLENAESATASLTIEGNSIQGDPLSFATTQVGVRVRLLGNSRTDLTVAGNSFANLALAAVDALAAENAQLQSRWSQNVVSQVNGPAEGQVILQDAAEAALGLFENLWMDAFGDGVVLEVDEGSRLSATVSAERFERIGDRLGDEALVITGAAGATGRVQVQVEDSSFATVAGNAFHVQAAGGADFLASVTGNTFWEIGTAGAAAAVVAEQETGASAAIGLKLADNSVLETSGAAYALDQRGTGAFTLEGTAETAAAEIAATNTGEPVVVAGTVTVVEPGSVEDRLPLVLGDRVWLDQDGDGVQGADEPGVGRVQVSLTGIESVGGAAVQRVTQSDSSGSYLFVGLAAGDYTLRVEVPTAYRLTLANQGEDDAVDSDFDARTHQVAVTPAAGLSFSIDAGLLPTWQNPAGSLDVNADGFVTPIDVLLVVNDINAQGIRAMTIPPRSPNVPPPFVDVDGDGWAKPLDVLLVVNFLNQGQAASGEAEADAVLPWNRQNYGRQNDSDVPVFEIPSRKLRGSEPLREIGFGFAQRRGDAERPGG